ncbi:MAG: Ig-like domain-containing protein [Cellvibrionaceae bacterium]
MLRIWITTIFIATSILLVGCQKEATTETVDVPVSASNVSTEPFQIVRASPSSSDTNIPVDQNIVITFNKSVAASSSDLLVEVENNAGPIRGSSIYSGNDVTFNPSNDFDYASNYTITVTIDNNINNAAAVSTTGSVRTWSFITEAQPTTSTPPPPSSGEQGNPGATSNYITDRRKIPPNYGSSVPAKGETRTDPITGIKITRLTDASELNGTNDAFIVYSRYTPENTSGDYFLAFGANSTSSWVINRSTGNVVTELKHKATNQVGENHEVRWDISGNHPYRIYYRYQMAFYMIDDVRSPSTTLLHDFSNEFPNSTKLFNDVEGDSSNDSDHWAFMATHYNGSTYVVDGYIHYQVSTNTVHTLRPADLAGTNLSAEAGRSSFTYRPNMVEMTPDGTGFIMHHGRKWDDSSYGGNGAAWIDTWYDGAYLWPADFDFVSNPPRKISVGETHSGWALDSQGREYFISQNNRTDMLDAVATTGSLYNYSNRLEVASHADFGWGGGFHYGKMPPSRPDWIFINDYHNRNFASYNDSWLADQLIMIKLDSITNNPTVWRIGSNYNLYTGNYRDEAPAAINYIGNRIYLSNNWGGNLNHREVFVYELPDNWNEVLN